MVSRLKAQLMEVTEAEISARDEAEATLTELQQNISTIQVSMVPHRKDTHLLNMIRTEGSTLSVLCQMLWSKAN